jgi:2-C-methyl-D-erythritol 4-phosphate cytidylyltransferase
MAANGPRAVAAILVAAGSGERLGAGVPKAFVPVAGRTLLEHAASRFAAHPRVDTVVVVAPEAQVADAASLTGLRAVAGGATRQLSVAAGLAALDPSITQVLVHDVARPFVPAAVIDGVLDALDAGAVAVVPVVPIHDTVRKIDESGALAGLVDRASLVAIQTPQGFDCASLRHAHVHGAELPVTDDAALVEAVGGRVVAVPGSDDSFKITTIGDLVRAEAAASVDRPGLDRREDVP